MRVLFDQGVPVPLRGFLQGHAVETAFERGWSTLKNGQLLDAAEREGFDLLVTTDQNLKYQQNLGGRRLAIIVLTTTAWPRMQPRVAEIVAAVDAIRPGGYVEVSI